MKTIAEDVRDYRKYFHFWRIAIGCAAMAHSLLVEDGQYWSLWFNVGDVGIWWQR